MENVCLHLFAKNSNLTSFTLWTRLVKTLLKTKPTDVSQNVQNKKSRRLMCWAVHFFLFIRTQFIRTSGSEMAIILGHHSYFIVTLFLIKNKKCSSGPISIGQKVREYCFDSISISSFQAEGRHHDNWKKNPKSILVTRLYIVHCVGRSVDCLLVPFWFLWFLVLGCSTKTSWNGSETIFLKINQ